MFKMQGKNFVGVVCVWVNNQYGSGYKREKVATFYHASSEFCPQGAAWHSAASAKVELVQHIMIGLIP